MKRRKLASLALAGALALGLSACNDDDNINDGTTVIIDDTGVGIDDTGTLVPETTMVTETTAAG